MLGNEYIVSRTQKRGKPKRDEVGEILDTRNSIARGVVALQFTQR